MAIPSAPRGLVPASSASGKPTTSASPSAVNTSSTTRGGETSEFAASSGGTPLNSVSLPANTQAVAAYDAYSEGHQSRVITVPATGTASDTQTETTT